MASYGFSIPFSFNSLGKTATVTDQRDLWRHRVYLLLLTRFGERLMRPDFGTELSATLFENQTLAVEIASRTITIAFNKWLPSLNLLEALPVYDSTTGLLKITVRYSLPTGTEDQLVISTGVFNQSGDLV